MVVIKMRILIISTLIILLKSNLIAQELNSKAFHSSSCELQKKAMYTLSGWSISNIIIGSLGYYTHEEESKYFNQMNVGWNIINLGIAGAGIFQLRKHQNTPGNIYSLWEEQNKLERIFLFNGALNFAYITSGIALRNYAYRDLDSYHRWLGYGNSLILQGGFLAVFDFANYFLHKRRADCQLRPYLKNIQLHSSSNGIGMTYKLN